MYVSMYPTIYLSKYLSIYLYVCMYVCMYPSLCFNLYIYLFIYLFICLFICVSVYISICLSVGVSVSFYLAISLFIYLSIYLAVYPSIYLCIYLSIYPSTHHPSICLFIYLSSFNYRNGTDEWCVCDFMRNVIWRLLIRNYVAENPSESEKKNLLSELELMKQLKPHPYVIKLLGCVTKSGKYWNVYYQLETLLFSHPEFRTLLEVKVTPG